VTNIIIWRFREAIPGVHNRIFALLSALDAEKSDSKKAKDGGKLSENHNVPTSRTMQDALQQVVREKDAALREKDAQNAFSEMPLEAKCGASRHILLPVTLCRDRG
jgi:hypothetical protein